MSCIALVRTEDGVFNFTMDIEKWLEQASDKEIVDVIECGFGDDYPTDQIAYFLVEQSGNDDLTEMFKYLEIIAKRTKRDIGFDVLVNKDEMIEWLKEHKPHISLEVKEEK